MVLIHLGTILGGDQRATNAIYPRMKFDPWLMKKIWDVIIMHYSYVFIKLFVRYDGYSIHWFIPKIIVCIKIIYIEYMNV